MTWEEYYDKFYDWANSTQINRISQLTSFGSADEVCEIAVELCDEAAATRLIKKAVSSGVAFSADQILELIGVVSEEGMNSAVSAGKCTFTREQLDDLCGVVSNDVFEKAASVSGLHAYEDDSPDADDDPAFFVPEPQPKIGLFGKLAIAFGVSALSEQRPEKHNGRCNGDCAHCPPHYGYRYGRWYYGHHHQYGCEFGGNKGR